LTGPPTVRGSQENQSLQNQENFKLVLRWPTRGACGNRQYLTADSSTSQRRTIIWGIGGAGKTQLAISYALKYDRDFSAIFFVSAKDTPTVRKDYCAIARYVKLPEALAQAVDKPDDLSAQDASVRAVKTWFIDHGEGD